MRKSLIAVENLETKVAGNLIHEDLNLTVKANEIVAIVGDSGCGKTTLLRVLLMLEPIDKGNVTVLGRSLNDIGYKAAQELRMQWGVMFQGGALFNDFTVLENIMFPILEFTNCSKSFAIELANLKLSMCGLSIRTGGLYPYELSGGMIKKVSTARAIALDPKLLFLDEPTAGLDPLHATGIDDLILLLKNELGLTVVLITHDLDSLAKVPDRIYYLGDKKVLATGTFNELKKQTEHQSLYEYFNGERARLIPN